METSCSTEFRLLTVLPLKVGKSEVWSWKLGFAAKYLLTTVSLVQKSYRFPSEIFPIVGEKVTLIACLEAYFLLSINCPSNNSFKSILTNGMNVTSPIIYLQCLCTPGTNWYRSIFSHQKEGKLWQTYKSVSESFWSVLRKRSVLKSKGWALYVLLWNRPKSWTMKLSLIH